MKRKERLTVEPSAPADAKASGLLDGMPRQRSRCAASTGDMDGAPVRIPPAKALRVPRVWRLLPTPTGTPFTFFFAVVLALTSLIVADAAPSLVHALHQGSSTDVAHLVRTPMLVLLTSALWIAGGIVTPYAVLFLLVLTALERRIGGARTAVVFLTGHILATLATEVPVGLAVLVGHLPDSSLHRMDYGISFGVATCVGALAGLVSPWVRWPLVVLFGGMLIEDLIEFTDPLTNWGHVFSLAIGLAMWPVVRRWRVAGRSTGLPRSVVGRLPARRG